MSKHTPGPWFAPKTLDRRSAGYIRTTPESKPGVYAICEVMRGTDVETFWANRQLIAAAPGMLETLKRLDRALKDCGPGFNELRIWVSVAIDAATGGSNE